MVWADSDSGWPMVKSSMAVGVNRALGEAGIEIPFPRRDVNFRNLSELKAAVPDMQSSAQPLKKDIA